MAIYPKKASPMLDERIRYTPQRQKVIDAESAVMHRYETQVRAGDWARHM